MAEQTNNYQKIQHLFTEIKDTIGADHFDFSLRFKRTHPDIKNEIKLLIRVIDIFHKILPINKLNLNSTHKEHLEELLEEALNSINESQQSVEVEKVKTFTARFNSISRNLVFLLFEITSQPEYSEELSNTDLELFEQMKSFSKAFQNQEESLNYFRQSLQPRLDSVISDFQTSLLTETNKFQEETKSLKESYDISAKKSLEVLNSHIDKGLEFVHYQGGKALSSFFNTRAEAEKKSAENWTKLTFGFAGLTIFALFLSFCYQIYNLSQNQQVDLSLLGTKVLITATLGLIAKWTSKRANRHLAEESKYQRLAINMKTIDSFINNLPETSQNEIMTQVALKTFTEVNGNETETDFETPNAIDALKGYLSK